MERNFSYWRDKYMQTNADTPENTINEIEKEMARTSITEDPEQQKQVKHFFGIKQNPENINRKGKWIL